jgi:hypothetical protein
MKPFVPAAAVALAFALAGCSRQADTPPPAAQAAPAAIKGGERIGWTQAAADVSDYKFLLYVDGKDTRELRDTDCRAAGPGKFDCSAPLPDLPAGPHTVQVGAVTKVEGRTIEGSRSDPFTITVAPAAATPR